MAQNESVGTNIHSAWTDQGIFEEIYQKKSLEIAAVSQRTIKNMGSKIVYIVHCVDAEGPLYESPEHTFSRLKEIFNIDLEPTEENLSKLLSDKSTLTKDDEEIHRFLDPHLIQNHGDWNAIESMLKQITRTRFRNQVTDSFGNGWIYNWFCLDHVCYETNPRKRDLGDHKIFDYYKKLLKQQSFADDRIHFHYHPLPYNKEAHSCATFYFNQNHIYRILAKKIIDRHWFPSVFRPGFHTIRPDSNWFLEQWIPFDYSNQASDAKVTQPDLANGRWGDWRRAPKIWAAYHPSHDDYQVPGTSRRWIFRCLNIRARLSQLEQRDVDAAFRQAQKSGAALLAFTDHDFRDMEADVIRASKMIVNASEKCPDVKFKYSNAVDGARQYLKLEQLSEIGFKIHLTSLMENSLLMRITSKNDLFGPQPFLAVKTRDGNYFYDNFDFDIVPRSWFYTFDRQTFPPSTIEKIGIASAHSNGLVEVLIHDFDKNRTRKVVIDQ